MDIRPKLIEKLAEYLVANHMILLDPHDAYLPIKEAEKILDFLDAREHEIFNEYRGSFNDTD